MVTRCITLTPWVNDKLKEEYNASALIDRALREHYKYNESEKTKEALLDLEAKQEREASRERIRLIQEKARRGEL